MTSTGSGRCWIGTSGFAYPDWTPRFYPPGLPPGDRLRHYAGRLSAVELNNTFYRRPSEAAVAAWVAATPPDFRFAVKAQRGAIPRAFAAEPEPGFPFLTDPYRAFGERLGIVLLRIPEVVPRDDDRLRRVLAAWPRDLPLAIELVDASWDVDESYEALEAVGASLVATDRDESDAPTLRRIGGPLYLRLRRADYDDSALATWAGRLEPFLAAGDDAYVFFAHDAVGRGGELALQFSRVLEAHLPGSTRPDRT
jgi:uncharacterized protein YecE (DUF72 family)